MGIQMSIGSEATVVDLMMYNALLGIEYVIEDGEITGVEV